MSGGLRRGLTDLDDFKQGDLRGGFLMRFFFPLSLGADETAAAAMSEHLSFEFHAVALCNGLRH